MAAGICFHSVMRILVRPARLVGDEARLILGTVYPKNVGMGGGQGCLQAIQVLLRQIQQSIASWSQFVPSVIVIFPKLLFVSKKLEAHNSLECQKGKL